MRENQIGAEVVDCAVRVHQALGPGLLESVCEAILARALRRRGLRVDRQVAVPIRFEDEQHDEGFRADLVVNDKVIIELKSIEKIAPVHKKQLLTYLRLTGLKLGYLLNFGEELMKNGITRIVNGLPDTSPFASAPAPSPRPPPLRLSAFAVPTVVPQRSAERRRARALYRCILARAMHRPYHQTSHEITHPDRSTLRHQRPFRSGCPDRL